MHVNTSRRNEGTGLSRQFWCYRIYKTPPIEITHRRDIVSYKVPKAVYVRALSHSSSDPEAEPNLLAGSRANDAYQALRKLEPTRHLRSRLPTAEI